MAGISYHWPASGLNTGTSLIGSYRLLSVPRGDGEVASVQGSDRVATEQAQRAIKVGGLTGQCAFGERDRDGGEHAAEVRWDVPRAQGFAQFFGGRPDALRGLEHGLLVEVPHLQRVQSEQFLDLARREAA